MSERLDEVEGFEAPHMANVRHPMPEEAAFLSGLAESAMEFVVLPESADIYELVAERLHAIIGQCWVAVASFDESTRELRQRAIKGMGTVIDSGSLLIGRKLVGYASKLNEEAASQIRTGRLGRLEGGLYEALLRAVPKSLAVATERMAGVDGIYGMGCVVNGQCLGSVLIALRHDCQLPPIEVVEAYVNQAAMALQRRRAEDAMRASEARYRSLVQQARDLCVVMTVEGIILEANPATMELTQRTQEELIGASVTDLMDASELAARPLPLAKMQKGIPYTDARWIERPDGTRLLIEAAVSPLVGGHLLVMGRDITERRQLERDLLDAGLRERQLLGRDLHDSLAQLLAGTRLSVEALRRRLEREGRAEVDDAQMIAGSIGTAIEEVGRILRGLCPVDVNSRDLGSALEQLAKPIRLGYDIACRVDVDQVFASRLCDEIAGQVCLVASEAVSNAARHSGCKTITVTLESADGCGVLRVQDDGHGIPEEKSLSSGMGLRTMRYRAQALDGVLDTETGAEGTVITCTFPLATPRDDRLQTSGSR